MRLGGYLDKKNQALSAWLHSANSGLTPFSQTGWWVSCWDWWVLDVTGGRQFQRINGGEKFLRPPGLAALYRPRLKFEEWQEASESVRESWILFSANGEMRDALTSLTAPVGYCHFEDPEGLILGGLQTISESLFYRKSGFQWRAQSTFLGLLAHLISSQPLNGVRRTVGSGTSATSDLVKEVEHYIQSRISQPLQVADLAARVGQSLSAFAHIYRRLARESPYRTILRLKMEAAKRLLVQDGFSVKETADQLGFSSEFQFSRCFKRMEGLAPSAHIRAMNAKSERVPA